MMLSGNELTKLSDNIRVVLLFLPDLLSKFGKLKLAFPFDSLAA